MFDNLLPFMMLGILLAAVLTRPLSGQRWVSLPVALMAIGFVASEVWVGLGMDTGLRWQVLSNLVFYLLLPILIFEAAINIDVRALRREAVIIAALAIPLLLVAIWITAALMLLLMGDTLNNNWAIALLIGSMICATDPAGVSSPLKDFGPARRMRQILNGEGLINDGTTITLFIVISGALALGPATELSFATIAGRFLLTMLGGAIIGVILGWLFDWMIAPANDKVLSTSVTLVLAFTSFWIGAHLLGLSGVVATLAAGLTVAWRQRKHHSGDDIAFALDSWRILGFCANAMLFFIVGMSITVDMFLDHWLAMLIGFLAAVVSRVVIVYLGAGPISRIPRVGVLSLAQQNLLMWGGVRGAVAMALALSLSVDIPNWYTIQAIVYGVAVFSMIGQTPLLPTLAARVDPASNAANEK